MEIKEILTLNYSQITEKQNLIKLVKYYKDVLNKDVCLSCRGSLMEMIKNIKKSIDMTNFELKGNKYFRISKESGKVINNNIMSDDLALEFLKEDEIRISYFSKYPDNWREMLENGVEDDSDNDDSDDDNKVIEDEAKKREALHKLKLKELKSHYPNVEWKVGMTKEDYITKILKA